MFHSKPGEQLSDKESVMQTLHENTGLAVQAPGGHLMTCFMVDERVRWAQGYDTKREDVAYSLLSVLNVRMPFL
ncbi:hypothetical protein AA0119_g13111 [Alternaria tenuissima]|uniref:Uncharacterized protein n=2 Tax=Alternaria alternata complex TaxID=187734 RepID=A0A4Q4MY13_ALTAL|nr:hypothetical protein AA0117_g12906 [Alternaria alternata]RYN85801.1 hypothetical protein AA0119_g13111 [Alternaria tenuissima]RYO03535.1 hypothetical protein AA0121_g13084 [Alternaria tenuissima]